ncbi:four-helix bundle copper-binding protein [Peribacillus simplex]|nr:four-helix bundle copper-binding protein [Peribacillus simplex]MDW7617254.1 four-helix bundle copper-binding protein [Peribacillus simplex]
MARGSTYSKALCQLCADVCDACATECARFEDDHCKRCAEACRQCATECRKMAS